MYISHLLPVDIVYLVRNSPNDFLLGKNLTPDHRSRASPLTYHASDKEKVYKLVAIH